MDNNKSFYYQPSDVSEFDSIVIMSKFYPWIVKYAQLKGLDNPSYLTKVTQTY